MEKMKEVDSPLARWKRLPTVKKDYPLSTYSSIRIGGRAKYVWEPVCFEEIKQYWSVIQASGRPIFVIGRGSNLLFLDEGYDGIIVSLKKGPRSYHISEKEDILTIEGDVYLPEVVQFLMKNKWKGPMDLVGIPGGILGSVCQNAGVGSKGICDYIEQIKIIDKQGQINVRHLKESHFSYRRGPVLEGELLIGVNFRLEKEEASESFHRQIKEKIKKRYQTQPLNYPSIGCVFKNTPQSPPTGKLIEEVGLKGYCKGDIQISERHSNFFINKGKGTAKDFLYLIDKVITTVYEKSQIQLDLEIKVVGQLG